MTPDPGPLHPSLPSAPSRRTLLQAGSLVLLLGTQQIARGATILAVRVWPAPEYSRVTIESDGQLTTKQFFVTTPPRLALDIEGIDLSPELRELVAKVKPDDPNIAGIRAGQNTPGVVRLVIDLKQAARCRRRRPPFGRWARPRPWWWGRASSLRGRQGFRSSCGGVSRWVE